MEKENRVDLHVRRIPLGVVTELERRSEKGPLMFFIQLGTIGILLIILCLIAWLILSSAAGQFLPIW